LDRLTDLVFSARTFPGQALDGPTDLLRRLRPSEGQALYELAAQARGPGQKWLGLPRRRRFVRTADERLFERLSGLWTRQRETFWGVHATDRRLRAGLSLRTSSGANRRPHRVEVWVHPGYRGRLEARLAQDLCALLLRFPERRALVSLAGGEQALVDALLDQGLSRVRTLILMKLEL
jgi:hypothetical protein